MDEVVKYIFYGINGLIGINGVKNYKSTLDDIFITTEAKDMVHQDYANNYLKKIEDLTGGRIFILDDIFITLELVDLSIDRHIINTTIHKRRINYSSYLQIIPLETLQNIANRLDEINFDVPENFWESMVRRFYPTYYKDLKGVDLDFETMYYLCKNDQGITYKFVTTKGWDEGCGHKSNVNDHVLSALVPKRRGKVCHGNQFLHENGLVYGEVEVSHSYDEYMMIFTMIYPILCKYIDLDVYDYIRSLNINKLPWNKVFEWLVWNKGKDIDQFSEPEFYERGYIIINIVYDHIAFKIFKPVKYDYYLHRHGATMLYALYLHRRDILDKLRIEILKLILDKCDTKRFRLLKLYYDRRIGIKNDAHQ